MAATRYGPAKGASPESSARSADHLRRFGPATDPIVLAQNQIACLVFGLARPNFSVAGRWGNFLLATNCFSRRYDGIDHFLISGTAA